MEREAMAEAAMNLVMRRAERLLSEVEFDAPEIIIRNEMRMLREAIEKWEAENLRERIEEFLVCW